MEGVEMNVDVLIVGAGISGIGAAAHLAKRCPNKTYCIVEQRQNIGGTWDLFRYPGVRSDSDMHTFGYRFKPWLQEKAIAEGPLINEYLHETVTEYAIAENIRFGYTVITADWSSPNANWTITARREIDGVECQFIANFLYMCSGYYNFSKGYKPTFKGEDNFAGPVIHPQHWPEELDYKNKRIVVIGSGATAVTIVPAIAETAAQVTMLQRSPTYIVSRPSIDRIAQFMGKLIPAKWAYNLTRQRNIWLSRFIYRRSRSNPDSVSDKIIKLARIEMPDLADFETHFTPKYSPWEQRLCLAPDGDIFKTLANGKAKIVTDLIDRFTEKGVLLKSGKELEADIIVTATGLNISLLGQLKMSVNGTVIDLSKHVWYKGVMFNDIPNMVNVFGYVNASWTLKVDIVADYVCRLFATMDKKQVTIAYPHLRDRAMQRTSFVEDFSPGYVMRSLDILPKNGDRHPWRLLQDYATDKKILIQEPVDDGVIVFSRAE